jgi:hypothetical protein
MYPPYPNQASKQQQHKEAPTKKRAQKRDTTREGGKEVNKQAGQQAMPFAIITKSVKINPNSNSSSGGGGERNAGQQHQQPRTKSGRRRRVAGEKKDRQTRPTRPDQTRPDAQTGHATTQDKTRQHLNLPNTQLNPTHLPPTHPSSPPIPKPRQAMLCPRHALQYPQPSQQQQQHTMPSHAMPCHAIRKKTKRNVTNVWANPLSVFFHPPSLRPLSLSPRD